MDVALDMLAERGKDGITLRELTDAAEANVAAVSYHFGSLDSLCDEALEHALEQYLDAQQAVVSTLGSDSTLEELADAFARPMLRALAVGGRELAVMRIVACAGIDHPLRGGIDSPPASIGFVPMFRRVEGQSPGSQGPGVDPAHALRRRNVELAGPRAHRVRVPGQVEKQLERLMVPVVAGAFQGASST